MGQDVIAWLTVDIKWLGDFVERLVGANPGHLQRTVAARVNAGGFVVVPKKA
jgi:hypothetical protein